MFPSDARAVAYASASELPAAQSSPFATAVDSDALTSLYKVLAKPHRPRLLHALAPAGEMPVGVLADEVGMSVQAVSNQLQRLADQRILAARRQGNQALYRIIDPCVSSLLEVGMCLVEQNPSSFCT